MDNLLIGCMVIGILCLFAVFRSRWVYTKRVMLIWSDFKKYKSLHSYYYMFWHFWVWDIEKFKNESKD